MARPRRPVILARDIKPGKRMRIRIPQPPDRATHLKKRDVVRWELIKDDPWWWTLHRRGPYRPWIGTDPREARAVSKRRVAGTLPERILWLALVKDYRFSPVADFDFQSSLQGGRMELGGIVADFMFPNMHIIINVQGPTHEDFLRKAKDTEQRQVLEAMGFTVWDISDTTIYNEMELERWLAAHFQIGNTPASARATSEKYKDRVIPYDNTWMHEMDRLMQLTTEKVLWLRQRIAY